LKGKTLLNFQPANREVLNFKPSTLNFQLSTSIDPFNKDSKGQRAEKIHSLEGVLSNCFFFVADGLQPEAWSLWLVFFLPSALCLLLPGTKVHDL
jgi:hypothetical protein